MANPNPNDNETNAMDIESKKVDLELKKINLEAKKKELANKDAKLELLHETTEAMEALLQKRRDKTQNRKIYCNSVIGKSICDYLLNSIEDQVKKVNLLK